jgi:DNA-binding protein Fis
LQAVKNAKGEVTVNMIGEVKTVTTNNFGDVNPINIRELCDNGETWEALEIILTAIEDEDKLEALTEMSIRIAMKKFRTNQRAADWLGLGRTTLSEKMKARNILRPCNKKEDSDMKELKCVN